MQQLILRVTERVHLADPAPEDPRSVSCIMLVLSLREVHCHLMDVALGNPRVASFISWFIFV
ncbi:MAG TPA: hypothetical protein DEF45_25410 [Rhodopirellula sp.]|nr:hypothetical protein [Rhodopirellula sp.]